MIFWGVVKLVINTEGPFNSVIHFTRSLIIGEWEQLTSHEVTSLHREYCLYNCEHGVCTTQRLTVWSISIRRREAKTTVRIIYQQQVFPCYSLGEFKRWRQLLLPHKLRYNKYCLSYSRVEVGLLSTFAGLFWLYAEAQTTLYWLWVQTRSILSTDRWASNDLPAMVRDSYNTVGTLTVNT